ncbi:hypothetical protein M23134_06524 [Microscilla marina ATCC 23134]|uniref:Uncharacterized protein n=1 Tax=Microscilla marina ATCC 23134 TaxID=313606 RepID=A1ZQQ9_MICM2|nr:hypothetical protein M23134_06524 [Microscilla marina ATCC 23134]
MHLFTKQVFCSLGAFYFFCFTNRGYAFYSSLNFDENTQIIEKRQSSLACLKKLGND